MGEDQPGVAAGGAVAGSAAHFEELDGLRLGLVEGSWREIVDLGGSERFDGARIRECGFEGC